MAPEPGNFLALLSSPEDDAMAQAEAMARRIRNQNAVAALSQLGGPQGLAGMGAEMGRQAAQQNQLFERGAVGRIHYAPQLEKSRAERAMYADNQLPGFMGTLGKEYGRLAGINVPDFSKVNPRAGMLLLKQIEELAKAKAAKEGQMSLRSMVQDRIEERKADDDMYKFAQQTNEISSARGVMKVLGENLYRMDAARALVDNNKGKRIPVTNQQLVEFASAVAKVASGSGNLAHEYIKSLTARGLKADKNAILQYITSRPLDTGMKEWVDHFGTLIEREHDVAKENLNRNAVRWTQAFPRLMKYRKNELANMLQTLGVDDLVDPMTLRPVMPGPLAGVVGKRDIAEAAKKLQPGERLAFDARGRPQALAPDEPVPEGYIEVMK